MKIIKTYMLDKARVSKLKALGLKSVTSSITSKFVTLVAFGL